MRNLENTLREAMADDVARIVPPPDLAEQVRVRHLRYRRLRAAAALGAVAAIVLVVPIAMAAVPHESAHPPAAPTPTAEKVDGVRVTYVPDGLVRDPVDGVDFGEGTMTQSGWSGWTARTGRWHPGSDTDRTAGRHTGLRVTVFRGGPVTDLTLLASAISGWDPATSENRPDGSQLLFRTDAPPVGEWIDVMWHAGEDLALRVRLSKDLEHELDRVIEGLRIDGPGEMVFAGGEPPPGGGPCDPATNIAALSPPQPSDEWDRFGGVNVAHLPEELAPGASVTRCPRAG